MGAAFGSSTQPNLDRSSAQPYISCAIAANNYDRQAVVSPKRNYRETRIPNFRLPLWHQQAKLSVAYT
jgi:hypothetical protein